MLSSPPLRDSVATMSSDLMNIDSEMKEIIERYESLVKNTEKDSDVQIKSCCDLYQELNKMKMAVAFYEEKINLKDLIFHTKYKHHISSWSKFQIQFSRRVHTFTCTHHNNSRTSFYKNT